MQAPAPAASVGDFTIEARDKIALHAQPFPLSNVRLLERPIKHAQELDRQYLLKAEAGK
jgi:hypothetical protein